MCQILGIIISSNYNCKTMTKLINKLTTLSVIVLSLTISSPVLAAGGSDSTYSPYSPHIPTDTGLITDGFIAAAIGLYFVGLILIGFSKMLNLKLVK